MKMSEMYPSKYLRAADLGGRAVRATIESVTLEQLGDGEVKPLVMFQGKSRGVILNKTNATVLTASLGDDSDLWRGRQVELHSERVAFQGKIVDAIRIRVPAPPQQQTTAPAEAGAPFQDDVPW